MANLDLAFVSLFWELMNRKTGTLGRVTFKPQKPAFVLTEEPEQPFPRSTPEEQGVDSAHIADFVRDLRTNDRIAAHSLMILRHGHVIYEGGFDPYSERIWHVTYSLCKSFTGMAIGLLVDDGRLTLDDRVVDILLPVDLMNPIRVLQRTRYLGLTVRHLLTMQSGSSFNEVGAISGNDWTRGFFDASLKFEPGTRFDYNSMNSYILSAIVTRLTGKTLFAFLQERLFAPMGIRRVYWETSPEGITKAGWGMFILPEDVAKLAQLYLNHGLWNGRQLISPEWIAASTSPQTGTGQTANPEYGYHIWMCDRPGSYMFNGMLGQNAYVYPDHDMIIVINAGNDEVFAGGEMTQLIRTYFGTSYAPSASVLPQNGSATRRLRLEKQLAENTFGTFRQILHGGLKRQHGQRTINPAAARAGAMIRSLDGSVYVMQMQSAGLFPLMMQVVHNNYTQGIRRMRIVWQDDGLSLGFLEGNVWNTIPVGLKKSRHAAVVIGGEEYLVGCRGRIGMNEDDEPVLTLRIAYIEEAAERLLKIVFHTREQIELRWNEDPGRTVIGETLEGITKGTGNINPIVDRLLEQVSPDLIDSAARYTMNPRVIAILDPTTGIENTETGGSNEQ